MFNYWIGQNWYKLATLIVSCTLVGVTYYLATQIITINNTIIQVTDYTEKSGLEQKNNTIISKWDYKFNKEMKNRDCCIDNSDRYNQVCDELTNNNETEVPDYYGSCKNQSKQTKTFLFKDNNGECYIKIVGLCA